MSLRRHLSKFQPPADDALLSEFGPQPDDDLFWPAFLLSFGGSLTAATAFDVDPADVEEYAEELNDPGCWPFLTVQLARGHRLHLLSA